MSTDGGFNLSEALESGADSVREFTRSFLGVERERFVCPKCGVACEESMTYDAGRAAFDGGESPSWECPDCSSHYVRVVRDESHSLDLYGRD